MLETLEEAKRPAIRSERSAALLIILGTFVLIFNVVLAWPAPRGTDHFWYIADVDSILHGVFRTNEVFPANMLQSEVLPGRFLHNNLTLYVAAPLARLAGSYHGWLLTNLLLTLGSGYLVYVILRDQQLPPPAPALTATLFLVLPQSVWLACNALSEPIYTFFIALTLWGWMKASSSGKFAACMVFALLAALCKDHLILVVVLLPMILIVLRRGRLGFRDASAGLGILIATLGAYGILRAFVFRENITYTLATRLISGIPPNNDIMSPFFLLAKPIFSWSLLWHKLAYNAPELVYFRFSQAPFWVPFYGLTVLAMIWVFKERKNLLEDTSHSRVIWFSLVLLLCYAAGVLGFQAEVRYTQIVIPSLIILTALKIRWSQAAKAGMILVLLLLAVSSFFLGERVRKEGRATRAELANLSQVVNTNIPLGQPIMLVVAPGQSTYIQSSFALRPRVTIISESSMFCSDLRLYEVKFHPEYALGRIGFMRQHGELIATLARDSGPFANFGLFRLAGPQHVCIDTAITAKQDEAKAGLKEVKIVYRQ